MRVPASKFVLILVKELSGLFPNLPAPSSNVRHYTRDAAALAELEADPLTLKEARPAKTVAAQVRADERLERESSRVAQPLLALRGRAE